MNFTFKLGSNGLRFLAAFLFSVFVLQSCATYQHKVQGARNSIVEGDYNKAAELLEPLALKPSDDQLVYLLDYAVALQLAGRYQESVNALLKADELADMQDYHSVSNIAGSLVLNEGMVQYKGDHFEKLLINAFLAINFLMMDKPDSAMVEVRRLNEKLEKLKLDGEEKHEQNEFAQYLSAMLWEAEGKWDDAYIAYERFYEISPDFPLIGQDLIRSAKKARRMDSLKKWKAQFPSVEEDPTWFDKNYGEVIVIYQQGWGPKKRPNPENFRYPILRHSPSHTQSVQVEIEGQKAKRSVVVHDISEIAIRTMNSYYSALIAKKLAALATKAVVADQIRQKNELLGELAWIAMNVADQADLRQWSTLPESFQVVRIMLPEGKYSLNLKGLNSSGYPSGEAREAVEVEIKAQKKNFVNWRSVH